MSTHSLELAKFKLQHAIAEHDHIEDRLSNGHYRQSLEMDRATAQFNVLKAEQHLRNEQLFDHLRRLKKAAIERQQAEERVMTAGTQGNLGELFAAHWVYWQASQKLLAVLNEDTPA